MQFQEIMKAAEFTGMSDFNYCNVHICIYLSCHSVGRLKFFTAFVLPWNLVICFDLFDVFCVRYVLYFA